MVLFETEEQARETTPQISGRGVTGNVIPLCRDCHHNATFPGI